MFARCKPQSVAGCRKGGRLESGESLDLERVVYEEATEPTNLSPRAATTAGFLSSCRPSTEACRSITQPCGEDIEAGNSDRYQTPLSQPGKQDPLSSLPVESATPYVRLEAGDSDEERNDEAGKLLKELASVKQSVGKLRLVVSLLALIAFSMTSVLLWFGYQDLSPEHQREAKRCFLLGSIPVVALLFTWFHIWLAIQMMFLPLKFVGLWEYGSTGLGIGWQGLVPRKSEKMARSSYTCARPFLEGPRDWLARVDPKKLVAQIRPELKQVIEGALAQQVKTYFPRADKRLPTSFRERITETALDKIQETSPALWKTVTAMLCDDTIGIDNPGMIVKVFTENKALLNEFFLTLGDREFRFIEHCGAAMGFFCGVLQLIAFNHLSPTGRAIFLPVTGFFLGIVTNWLAIQMVFRPVFPIPVRLCGWHIYDIQGLFLKRQKEVCVLYSKMLKDNFLAFDKVISYLQTLPELWPKLKEAYLAHNTKVMRQTLGSWTTWSAELAIGQQQFQQLEEDLKVGLVQGLHAAHRLHDKAGKYIGRVTDLEARNRQALQRMPPDEFENLLHPVFQEDEWILILLGGVLGAIVGIAQVYFLSD